MDATPTNTSPQVPAPPAVKYYLVFFQSGLPYSIDPFGSINLSTFQEVQRLLEDGIKTPPEETEIDVWLESPGGDASIAYKLFLELQHRCRKLRAVVPDYAKSAATLFLLGTDEFFMAPSAELGPLDAQIAHPDRDREDLTVSALDVAKAPGFLADFAADYIVECGNEILDATGLPRSVILREVARFTARFLQPLAGKFDPYLWHRASNQLDIAYRYARIMLGLRRLAPDDMDEDRDDDGLVRHLMESFPAHDFVISRADAKKLPLPVRNAEDYERWAEVRLMHRGFHTGELNNGKRQSVFDVWTDADLDNLDHDDGGDDEGPESTTDTPHHEG